MTPRRALIASAALATVGLVLAGVLAYEHAQAHAGATSFCAINDFVNCDRAATSSYSVVLGLPVAVSCLPWTQGVGATAGSKRLRSFGSTGVYLVQSPSGGGRTSWFVVHTAWCTGAGLQAVLKAHPPPGVGTKVGPAMSM